MCQTRARPFSLPSRGGDHHPAPPVCQRLGFVGIAVLTYATRTAQLVVNDRRTVCAFCQAYRSWRSLSLRHAANLNPARRDLLALLDPQDRRALWAPQDRLVLKVPRGRKGRQALRARQGRRVKSGLPGLLAP